MEWSQDWGSENQVYHLASRLMRGILKKPSFPLECKLQRAEVMLVAFTALSPACRKGEDQFKCWTVTCCMNYTSLVYSFHVCKTLILRTFTFQIIWEPFEYKSERFRARIAYPAVPGPLYSCIVSAWKLCVEYFLTWVRQDIGPWLPSLEGLKQNL